jgi:IS605 OrfB family transposase
MIKSSRLSLKFGNTHRQADVSLFLDEYMRITREFVNMLWNIKEVNCLLDRRMTSSVDTWLSARMCQCAGKQASGIVRGTRKKQEQRLHMIGRLNKEKKFKQARKLQKIYDRVKITKPDVGKIEAQLDDRFVKVDWDSDTSFDGWITLTSVGNGMKIVVPIKKSRHFSKLAFHGELRKGLRLSKTGVTFCFDIPTMVPSRTGVVGIDVGMTDTLCCSDGQTVNRDCHGHTYGSICEKIARKRKGGNGFRRACRHRTNYLHWAVKRLNLSRYSVLQRENIRGLRKHKRNNRYMQAWNYAELFKILDGAAAELGVQVRRLNPAYTSQRCSECGWTRRDNRKGKQFKCGACGHTQDADLNASRNLSFDLQEISEKVRQRQPNRTGFYWIAKGQESIVPVVQTAVS